MRAVRIDRFGGPEVLEVVDVPEPHAGPGQVRIAVRAAGTSPTDVKRRKGDLDDELPLRLGYEAAGVVDEVGEGVSDTAVGDRVFGFAADAGTQAERAALIAWAPVPNGLDFAQAAALPAALETAERSLNELGVGEGTVLLVNGASGSVGRAAVQLAVARGARVIGTAGSRNQDAVRSIGAEPVVYGEGMPARVRALAPHGVDRALDVAGSGVLPELIDLAGGAEHVLTVADFAGAQRFGVRFSRGDAGRALQVIGRVGGLIDAGRFRLPAVEGFPLDRVADAHRAMEAGSRGGKVVLTIGP